ncbi:MAG: UDP-N-acetylmuramate--L-alanine ligase [Flavobacteriaceae bacterium]
MRPPIDTGLIHFVGIGGIGMSGIAEILLNLGYQVQGSDAADSANVKRLREHGAKVFIGHDAANLGDARVVVVSSAIKRDNPELAGAREKRLPVVRRADMLAQLMRFKSCIAVAGTHGKTTTTSIVASLLDAGGFDPTVVNGGIINAFGTNARLGKGDWMVVEADESDGTFVRLPAEVGIITNIDPEHLDHYGSFEAAKAAFKIFVENLPFYGFAVMCIDHPEVQALVGRIEDRTVITYGENPQADMRLVDVQPGPEGTRFAVVHRARLTGVETRLDDLMLPMPGRHNTLNAVAALSVAYRLGVRVEKIRQGLKNFGGVKRRFTLTGTWNGVRVYDDYGHHPVEIAAALKAARDACRGRVVAVMQPHRYTRLKDLFNDFCSCFNDADTVIVADVYAAGETPIAGIDADALVAGVRGRGHRDARRLANPEALARLVADIVRPDDLVICLGAGSITQWAYALPAQLESIRPSGGEAS